MSSKVETILKATSINSSFHSMDVQSAMENLWSTAVKDAFNKTGSKFTSLNVQDRCQKQEIPFYLVMCRESKLPHHLSKSQMMEQI